MKDNTPLSFSDLKYFRVSTFVTKITISAVFQAQKLNFVLVETNRYLGEIAYPLLKVLATIYGWIVFNVCRANICLTM